MTKHQRKTMDEEFQIAHLDRPEWGVIGVAAMAIAF